MTINFGFAELRGSLDALVGRLGPQLPAHDVRLITEFVQAGEYGVALEHLVRTLDEERAGIDSRTFSEIAELGALMSIPREKWEMLADRIAD